MGIRRAVIKETYSILNAPSGKPFSGFSKVGLKVRRKLCKYVKIYLFQKIFPKRRFLQEELSTPSSAPLAIRHVHLCTSHAPLSGRATSSPPFNSDAFSGRASLFLVPCTLSRVAQPSRNNGQVNGWMDEWVNG